MSNWSACPNDPPCGHSGLIHDIYDFDDERPMCCAEGCDCGKGRGPEGDHSSERAR